MKVSTNPPVHLTYCLNVHPGESWAENFTAIRQKAAAVRRIVAAGEPFGLGLRLSCRAADELASGENLPDFREYLRENGLYVFTVNGFAYGQFHETTVKENVYKPDWTNATRRDYTNLLGDILAALLEENAAGSISTVPVAYGPPVTGEEYVKTAVGMLAESAMHMDELRRRTGREIVIALEAEPGCLLETTSQVIAFFAGPLAEDGCRRLHEQFGVPAAGAKEILARHIGVCFDTAHQAVEFENLSESLRRLREAGIRIAKIQLSSALALKPTPENLQRLRKFDEEVYLHQVRVRPGAGDNPLPLADLPDALASRDPAVTTADEWRVHFHVPLFFDERQALGSTSKMLTGKFAELLRGGVCPHLEIETYTWGVLPNGECNTDIVKGIAKEFQWVKENLFLQHVESHIS
jgi:sugar phosphate isomerase/epimerase